MGDTTNIEWTEKTWNPWHGCHKISPGCKFCYMFRDKERYGQDGNTVVRSKTTFNAPLSWKESATVFTCSWSDWFIEEADEWRGEARNIIRSTPRHTYQILTKRIDRAARFIPVIPDPNVWLGVSVENRKHGLPRIDILRTLPAAIRFLSVEPLLEDLGDFDLTGISWVIAGGESGPEARPMAPEWVRRVRDLCTEQRVPFFFKQWGEYHPAIASSKYVDQPVGDGTHHRLFRIGKKAAGRELDGRVWSDMPRVHT